MLDLLKKIRATLDSVEVRGKTNLDYLLGCMLTLDGLIRELEVKDHDKQQN